MKRYLIFLSSLFLLVCGTSTVGNDIIQPGEIDTILSKSGPFQLTYSVQVVEGTVLYFAFVYN